MSDSIQQPASGKVSRQGRTGIVRSVRGDTTVHVTIDNLVKEPRYGKYIHRRIKLAVHDPKHLAGVGDVVEVVPCRRISKTKAWRLLRVIRKGETSFDARIGVSEGQDQ